MDSLSTMFRKDIRTGMDAAIQLKRHFRFVAHAILAIALVATGCGTIRNTNTPRSGTEQILLTGSFDQALRRIDFGPLSNAAVYFESKHIDSVDKGWVISAIREAMIVRGVRLVDKPEDAGVIVEGRIGALGTDDYSFLIGVPQMTIPVTLAGLPTGTIPEIALMKKQDQHALSKLALFAYDKATGAVVWTSGTATGFANSKNTFIGGMGPIQSGTHKKNPEFMGLVLPQMTVQPVPIRMMPWPEYGANNSAHDSETRIAGEPKKPSIETPRQNPSATKDNPIIGTDSFDPEVGGEKAPVVPIPIPLPSSTGSPFSFRFFHSIAPRDRNLLRSDTEKPAEPAKPVDEPSLDDVPD
jgi:hypothetical protein